MPTSSFAVPTILTTATLHFAEVAEDATIQDVIDALVETARSEVLGDLDDQGWALQKIRVERNGRPWEEDELEALGDGTLDPSTLVAPLVNGPPVKTTTQRHFSSFPMTAHLHTPVLRLVSLHSHLSIYLSFLRVPEIHDDFRYKVFISKTTTIHDVVNSVIDELGLTKFFPVPGGGSLEYILEEVWKDAESEKSSRLPGSSLIFSIVETSFCQNPYTSAATRSFRFCVPDEWYRRSKSRSVSTASTEPAQSTIRRLAVLQEFDEDEDDEGTARMSSPEASATTGGGTISQSRLSTLFDGWFQASPPSRSTVVATSEKRKSIVSEPILVENQTSNGSITGSSSGQESDFDEAEFEALVNNFGLKNDKRTEMLNMSPERKRTILSQHKLMKAGTTGSVRGPALAESYGPSSAAGIIPRIVPQLTGDGLMKRFSMWGVAPAAPPVVSEGAHISGEFDKGREGLTDRIAEEPKPVLPQSTGGRWSNWWSLSSGDKVGFGDSRVFENSPKWYVDGLKRWKTTDIRMLKHIISLRVHLRNASMVWVEEFLSAEKGLDALTAILAGLVGKGGKRRDLTEIETNCLLEIVKCFKVFLNAGNDQSNELFDRIIDAPMIVTYITYSLHVPSPELRTMSSEILAALSFLSPDGHKAALSALSDYRVAYDEAFRFEGLVNSLQLPSGEGEFTDDIATYLMDMDDEEVKRIWNPRAAVMSLVNALTNCPNTLEDRIVLREEFSRRGLNEIIVALRYVKPPEYVMNQLNVYTEEKLDDDAEMRERTRGMMRRTATDDVLSDAEDVLQDIAQLAQEHGELYPVMVDILRNYNDILGKNVELQLKADLLTVLDKFVGQAAMLDKFDDSWHIFMKRFASSVSHITGQELEVKAASESDHIIEEELESLRTKVEELSDERTKLKNELNQQIAEMNALKSLPLSGSQGKPSGKGGPESFHGVVQRLVQKEKQVLQLQSELERIKSQQHPIEARDADERAKQARDRTKWNTLMDEIAKLKAKNSEAETSLGIKDKEIVYLKRALESVYSRFSARKEHREEAREAEMDAELMVARTIESLSQKDDQIASLCIEVADLKAQVADVKAKLASKPKTEKEFKALSPPPPPPSKPKCTSTAPTHASLADLSRTDTKSPPPPPPPPPPPARLPSIAIVAAAVPTSSTPLTISGLPPPPPPPPPPLLSDVSTGPPPPPPPPPPVPAFSSGSPPLPPPPSLGTGPPLPPLPPPAFRMGGMRPKVTRPVKRLKPFFWNKINNSTVSNTVWREVATDIQFDLNDLETTFTIDNSTSTSSRLQASPIKKSTVTTLLDITRANHIAIMLKRIKLDFPGIRRALLELSDDLSIDDLRAIGKHLPTPDEVNRMKDFEDVGKLAMADQYFGQIISIPRLSQRLDCMLYRRRLDLDIAEIRPDLNTLRNAALELRGSTKFKQILQAILAVGNALNGSSFRGGAQGFQLEALLKMKETKTAKAGTDCPTLLHYLARVLLRSHPNLVNFIEDLPNVEAAARLSVQTIMQSVNSMASGLAQIKTEITQLKPLPALPDDRFILVMQPFVVEVGESIIALKNMGLSLEGDLHSLLVYYGENPDAPDAPKPEDFFGLIVSFSSSLQKCALEVHDSQQKSGVQATPSSIQITVEVDRPAEPPQTIKANPDTQGSHGRTTGGKSVGRGDLDQAIRSMRDGKRRARPARPLSKIFLDGAPGSGRPQSRFLNHEA